MTRFFALGVPTSLLALGVAGTATAQTTLLVEGDMIPGVGLVTRIDDVMVNDNAEWILEVATDAAAANDLCVIVNGALHFQEGTSLNISAPAGATFSSLDSAKITSNGDQMFLINVFVNGSAIGNTLYYNGNLLIEPGVTPITAAGIPMGSLFDGVSEAVANDNNQILIGARYGTIDFAMVIDHDGMGNITGQTLLAQEGQMLTAPGHLTPIQGFSFTRTRQAINNSGTTLWFVDDDHTVPGGMTCCDSWIYRDNMPLWHENDPIVPSLGGSVYGTLSSAECDINNNGDYVLQSGRDTSFTLDFIIKNDTTIIAEEGMPVAGVPGGPFVLTTIGSTTGCYIGDNGDVLWYGDWDDPNTDVDTGLFINQTLLIQEGVSTVDGNIVDTIAATDQTFHMSDSGRYVIVELFSIDPADPTLNGAYLYDLMASLGTAYCDPAVANTSGGPAFITVTGSESAAANDMTLVASGMPVDQFGFFLTGMTQGLVSMPGGISVGNLCLGGTIGRYVGPGQVLNSGAGGTFSLVLDLTQTPAGMVFASIQAGETWNFQAWFRDSLPGGGPTSNFTDARSVTFN